MVADKRRTKIVATIGPATSTHEEVRALVEAGVDAVRMNFSHGSHEDHAKRAATVRAVQEELGKPLALIADLQGPKLRIGELDVPRILVRDEEITVVGEVAAPALPAGAADAERKAAWAGRIKAFREDTRGHRMDIADEAEHRFGRKVSWGVRCGDETTMFTQLSVPVMTRLRQQERRVLDTLVDAGVARSRSDALAWCVRLVGKNADDWLGELRDALLHVERARAAGPQV